MTKLPLQCLERIYFSILGRDCYMLPEKLSGENQRRNGKDHPSLKTISLVLAKR